MAQQDDPQEHSYPIGRGYGNDYMRGGEVLGGYGYSAREEYERRRGEATRPDRGRWNAFPPPASAEERRMRPAEGGA